MTALVSLENVTLAYGRHVALEGVNASFPEGSLTAVAGPNGSGKSTMLKAVAGILKPRRGRVIMGKEAAKSLAYLPQTQALQRDFPMTVEEAAAGGFYPRLGDWGMIDQTRRAEISYALKEVGLEGFEKRGIEGLSSGQFQRLLFARLMLQDAKLILLDEPFAAVDAETTAKLINLLLQWHRQGRTVVCVLHDLLLIKKYFPQAIVLGGKCLGRGHTHELFEQKLLSFDLDMAELCPDEKHATHHHHGHDHEH
ncbi:MAG TPA: ABC transporter ATP-binding protein [Alphaproteobacteria bacterium]|nr:ABC transporter ATP-binding protein [Alphaproteobacteria bacterium]